MERLKDGTICPHIKSRKVGCFCEFCDYMYGLTADNDVDCVFEDTMKEMEEDYL